MPGLCYHYRMIQQIATDDVIQQAYDWLCERRVDYSANNDVWLMRCHWGTIKPQLQAELQAGDYQFSPVQRIRGEETTIELWSSLDALVLKAIAIVLAPHLNVWCEFSQSMILIGFNACRGSVSEPADRRGNYAPTESRQINSHQAFKTPSASTLLPPRWQWRREDDYIFAGLLIHFMTCS